MKVNEDEKTEIETNMSMKVDPCEPHAQTI